MLFNSIQFLIFLPLVVLLYYAIPYKYRWVMLLVASYYFYMCWKPEYLILIIVSTLIDYYVGLKMGQTEKKRDKKIYLFISLVVNLGLLFAFKYFNFFNESFRSLYQVFDITYHVPSLKVLLPVGISFYTFQTLSYSIDVYNGKKVPEKHLGIFALYVAFFPQLVAGPIERSTHLMPQFHEKHDFSYDKTVSGLRLIMWGFFKKLVIADNLALLVNNVYNNPGNHTSFSLLVATYCFAFQIFCDFSGYSDIAIGSARIMGYDLMQNFRRPYFAQSIAEFWKRWHISLSTWFRDYLYIPLGGNRVSKIKWYRNLIVVFVLSGMWHGANWTFIVWGLLHGIYLMISIIMGKAKNIVSRITMLEKIPSLGWTIRTLITFHLVLFAWIFFRANSLKEAGYIITHIFTKNFSFTLEGIGFSSRWIITYGIMILFMEIIHLFEERKNSSIVDIVGTYPIALRWIIYNAVIICTLLLGFFGSQQFIYFQF